MTARFSFFYLLFSLGFYSFLSSDILDPYRYGPFAYGRTRTNMKERKIKQLSQEIQSLQSRLNEADIAVDNAERELADSNSENKAQREAQYKNFLTRRSVLQERHDKKMQEYDDISCVDIGQVIARGLVGKDWESIADADIKGAWDGIQKGFIMKTSRAVGDVFDEKIRGTINHLFGGAWDWILGGFIDTWDTVCSVFFHDSKEPFSEVELESWRTLVIASIEDLERTIKDGVRDSTRGQDMTPRSKGLSKDDHDVALEEEKTMWTTFVEVYVDQFYYLIDQIEKHKQYYDEKHHVEFYSGQIKRRLEDLIDLLINSHTVKEVDAKLESNKNIITAMKKNIDHLFKRMIDDIKPRTYSVTKDSVTARNKGSSGSTGRNGYNSSDMDGGFPMSHQSGYGTY